jgi:hypothetical protein
MEIGTRTLWRHLETNPKLAAARELGIAKRNQNLLACMQKAAQEGNAAICIFLSQQWLGMVNRKAIEHSGPGGGPVPVAGELGAATLEERLAQLIARRERRERGTREAPVG